MKYLLILLLFLLGASSAASSPFLDEARERMLKCAFKEVKPEFVDRAYDHVRKNTRKRTSRKKKESLDEAVQRSTLECAISTIDSMLTYKKLMQ